MLDYGKNKQISKLTLVLSRNTGPSISFDFLFHLLESSLCVAQICPLPGFSFVHFRYSIGLALCFFAPTTYFLVFCVSTKSYMFLTGSKSQSLWLLSAIFQIWCQNHVLRGSLVWNTEARMSLK